MGSSFSDVDRGDGILRGSAGKAMRAVNWGGF
jgi:hypothetical protein